jgi:hypothetical protein
MPQLIPPDSQIHLGQTVYFVYWGSRVRVDLTSSGESVMLRLSSRNREKLVRFRLFLCPCKPTVVASEEERRTV